MNFLLEYNQLKHSKFNLYKEHQKSSYNCPYYAITKLIDNIFYLLIKKYRIVKKFISLLDF